LALAWASAMTEPKSYDPQTMIREPRVRWNFRAHIVGHFPFLIPCSLFRVGSFDDFREQPRRIHVERACNLDEFDDIYIARGILDLADEGLLSTELLGERLLSETSGDPALDEHLSEYIVGRACPWHRCFFVLAS